MFKFNKTKKTYDVLQIFKIVSLEDAKIFPAKKCISICLNFLNDYYYSKPDIFDINYGKKEWHSFENFEKSLAKYKEDKIFYLFSLYSSSKSSFRYTNNILNKKGTSISYINLTIALEKSFIHSNDLLNLLKKLNCEFEIDYAYGFTIDEDFNFDTERKIKKSFFGTSVSVSVTQQDIAYEHKKTEFNNGYVQKIYPLNLLNESQLKSLLISKNIDNNIGQLSKFNNKLFCWTLNSNELSNINY